MDRWVSPTPQIAAWTDRLALLLVLTLSLTLAVLGASLWPAADDFCNRAFVDEGGVAEALNWLWYKWSGRLATSTVIDSVLALLPMDKLHWVSALLGLGIVIVAWQMLAFWRLEGSRLRWPLLACVAGALGLGFYPILGQTVVWFTGGIVYLLPLLVALHWLNGMRRLASPERSAQTGYWLAVSLFLGNSMELLLPVLFTYACFHVARHWATLTLPVRRALAWRVIGVMVGALVLLVAPGNYKRASLLPGSFEIDAARMSGQYLHLLGQSLVTGQMLWWSLAALALTALALRTVLRKVNRQAPAAPALPGVRFDSIVLLMGAALSITPLLFVPGFATPRNALYLYAFGFLAGLGIVADLIRGLERRPHDSYSLLAPAVFTGLALIIVGTATYPLIKDIGAAWVLRAELEARDRVLHEARARGVRDVVLSPVVLFQIPRTVHFVDFSEDPKEWLNMCTAKYYGVDQIRPTEKA